MKKTEGWQCPSHAYSNAIRNSTTHYTNINGTNVEDIMYDKLRQMMGSLILASLLEVLLGCTGMIGLLMRYIGPLTVAPVISLIGLSLFKIPLNYAQKHWGISGLSAALVTIFILYLNKVRVPLPVNCLNGRPTFTKVPVFQLFPVLFAMAISWIFCAILTITNVLPDDPSSPQYLARTDARLNIIKETPWFYVPYPGQFGSPLFNTSIFVGFLASVISSVLESVGDYHAVATATNSPPPPQHAVNRGILLEGLGSVLSGFMGAGHATTSYTNNIAIVGITKVASRSCLAAAGLFALLLSLVGRVGAVLSTIPDPVIGGTMLITFGILTAIGLFMLKSLDLSSSRNMAIFGISLYIGLAIPDWIKANPEAASTGYQNLDDVIKGCLGTPMFLGGLVGFVLDNTIRGTQKERGFDTRESHSLTNRNASTQTSGLHVYRFAIIDRFLKRPGCWWLAYVPFIQDSTGQVTERKNMDQDG